MYFPGVFLEGRTELIISSCFKETDQPHIRRAIAMGFYNQHDSKFMTVTARTQLGKPNSHLEKAENTSHWFKEVGWRGENVSHKREKMFKKIFLKHKKPTYACPARVYGFRHSLGALEHTCGGNGELLSQSLADPHLSVILFPSVLPKLCTTCSVVLEAQQRLKTIYSQKGRSKELMEKLGALYVPEKRLKSGVSPTLYGPTKLVFPQCSSMSDRYVMKQLPSPAHLSSLT